MAAKQGRNRLRWVLETGDVLDAELDRLMGLGASLARRDVAGAELTDPEGNEFILRHRSG